MRAGARETDPAAIGFRRCEETPAQVLGQAVVNRQFPAHKSVGLGVASPLEPAPRKVAHEMPTHLVDHRLSVLILAKLWRLFGQSHIVAAATQIDERRQQNGDRHTKDSVESGTQEGLLDPPLEVQKDFENSMQEPKKHRGSAAPWPL